MSDRSHAAQFPQAAIEGLACADVNGKLERTAALARDVAHGTIRVSGDFEPAAPDRPGRPKRPLLVEPRELHRRSTSQRETHAALIHAVAHIEFNAIDLALDAACRFAGMPEDYYADWLHVAQEEALHFSLVRAHLASFDHDYGDFPAHDGLWRMARNTAHDPLLRMALVPRVLEARGLDASPAMIRRLRAAGDARGAEILAVILRDEVGHVAIGTRWFRHLCAERGLDPDATFARLLRESGAPLPVAPLNVAARRDARFSAAELADLDALAQKRRGAAAATPRPRSRAR